MALNPFHWASENSKLLRSLSFAAIYSRAYKINNLNLIIIK
jgi:hypothetical protein